MTDQFTVPATPTQDQVQAGLRQTVLFLSGIASAVGMAGLAGELSAAMAFVGPASAVVVFVWGQLYTRSRAKRAAVMAAVVPDSVAVLKG